MPGVEAFAYDLVAARGPVSSRVALLLRSTEGKPLCALAFFERISLPIQYALAVALVVGGGEGKLARALASSFSFAPFCSPGEHCDIYGLGWKSRARVLCCAEAREAIRQLTRRWPPA
jgi:hypothetical protein